MQQRLPNPEPGAGPLAGEPAPPRPPAPEASAARAPAVPGRDTAAAAGMDDDRTLYAPSAPQAPPARWPAPGGASSPAEAAETGDDRTLIGAPPPRMPAPGKAGAASGADIEAGDDRTLIGAPLPYMPAPGRAGAASGADVEAGDDRTLFGAALPHMPAPGRADAAHGADVEADGDRTLYGAGLPPETKPRVPASEAGSAPGTAADDDRTLFIPLPGGGPHAAAGALNAAAAADADAPTLFVSPDDVPTLRMPAPGAATIFAAEDDDGDRTLYAPVVDAGASDFSLRMPAPGGQATALPPAQAAAAPRAPRAGVELQRLVAGVNPLLGAASVLLALVAQLRATSAHADPAGLRRQLLAHVSDFEAQAAASGVTRPRVTAARYLLCTFLDEVIAATPWGQGSWEAHTLLGEFHEERWGGIKAFELLEKLGENPAANAEVLELFYVCLALGFEGRYRGQPDARARLDAIAERVLEAVRPAALQQQGAARSLSLHWQGVAAPQHPGLHLPPLWSVCVLAGAVVLAALLLFQQRLATQAQPLLRELHALPAALLPQRAASAPTAPAATARLAPLLQAEAASGAVAVRDERQRSVLTLGADALFKGGSAELQTGAAALLGRVAQALRAVPGQVNVIGHSDDNAAASLQFPSSWHLSRARALAVMAELARQGVPEVRLHAEGRADAEPLAPGATAVDRARNRRVEIELRLPRPED
jgi:type VI secretion system protein ImpK